MNFISFKGNYFSGKMVDEVSIVRNYNGVEDSVSEVQTTTLRGRFQSDPYQRQEFFRQIEQEK